MPSSVLAATKAYVDESAMVVIDLTPCSLVKPSEPSVTFDATVGSYGSVMFMI